MVGWFHDTRIQHRAGFLIACQRAHAEPITKLLWIVRKRCALAISLASDHKKLHLRIRDDIDPGDDVALLQPDGIHALSGTPDCAYLLLIEADRLPILSHE